MKISLTSDGTNLVGCTGHLGYYYEYTYYLNTKNAIITGWNGSADIRRATVKAQTQEQAESRIADIIESWHA